MLVGVVDVAVEGRCEGDEDEVGDAVNTLDTGLRITRLAE